MFREKKSEHASTYVVASKHAIMREEKTYIYITIRFEFLNKHINLSLILFKISSVFLFLEICKDCVIYFIRVLILCTMSKVKFFFA